MTVKVANMDGAESIGVVVNGVKLLDSSVQRVDEQIFEVPVGAPPLRRGINQITVVPGLNSTGRLTSEVTWLELHQCPRDHCLRLRRLNLPFGSLQPPTTSGPVA